MHKYILPGCRGGWSRIIHLAFLPCDADAVIGPSVVFANVIDPRSFIERKVNLNQRLFKKGPGLVRMPLLFSELELVNMP